MENTELHNPDREVEVDFKKFFLIGEPTKVEPAFKVQLTKAGAEVPWHAQNFSPWLSFSVPQHTYLPKVRKTYLEEYPRN
jgi:hypothetical protein